MAGIQGLHRSERVLKRKQRLAPRTRLPLMTQYTSFIAVEDKIVNQGGAQPKSRCRRDAEGVIIGEYMANRSILSCGVMAPQSSLMRLARKRGPTALPPPPPEPRRYKEEPRPIARTK